MIGYALVSAVDHALSVKTDEQAEQAKTKPQINAVQCLNKVIINKKLHVEF